jgi:hypothetical protein
MASAWIPTGGDQQRLQGMLHVAINQLTNANAILQTLTNIMAQMLGASSDYTTIETYFGLQAGQGQPLHDVLGSAASDLQGSNIQGLLQRFG